MSSLWNDQTWALKKFPQLSPKYWFFVYACKNAQVSSILRFKLNLHQSLPYPVAITLYPSSPSQLNSLKKATWCFLSSPLLLKPGILASDFLSTETNLYSFQSLSSLTSLKHLILLTTSSCILSILWILVIPLSSFSSLRLTTPQYILLDLHLSHTS